MNNLFIESNGVKYSLSPRLEGIYDRDSNLIGHELLSSVYVLKTKKTIAPDYFFNSLSIDENFSIIKHQLSYIKSKSHDLLEYKRFITINANESFIKLVFSELTLFDLIHSMSNVIRIEINERVDTTKNREALEYLSTFCTLWLDDLGCGDYKQQKNFNKLFEFIKFDKNTISTILSFTFGQQFLRTMVSELHKDGVKIVAEGVEDLDTFIQLLDCGFDAFQGWYWK